MDNAKWEGFMLRAAVFAITSIGIAFLAIAFMAVSK